MWLLSILFLCVTLPHMSIGRPVEVVTHPLRKIEQEILSAPFYMGYSSAGNVSEGETRWKRRENGEGSGGKIGKIRACALV